MLCSFPHFLFYRICNVRLKQETKLENHFLKHNYHGIIMFLAQSYKTSMLYSFYRYFNEFHTFRGLTQIYYAVTGVKLEGYIPSGSSRGPTISLAFFVYKLLWDNCILWFMAPFCILKPAMDTPSLSLLLWSSAFFSSAFPCFLL